MLLAVTVSWQAWAFMNTTPASPAPSWFAAWLAPLSGVFLLAGWLTPASSVVAAVSLAIITHSADPATANTFPLDGIGAGCLVVVALAVSLLGPGAYSIDARWFGRREIVFTDSSPLS